MLVNSVIKRIMSKKCGLKQSAIARIESDKKYFMPRLSTIHKILLSMGYRLNIKVDQV